MYKLLVFALFHFCCGCGQSSPPNDYRSAAERYATAGTSIAAAPTPNISPSLPPASEEASPTPNEAGNTDDPEPATSPGSAETSTESLTQSSSAGPVAHPAVGDALGPASREPTNSHDAGDLVSSIDTNSNVELLARRIQMLESTVAELKKQMATMPPLERSVGEHSTDSAVAPSVPDGGLSENVPPPHENTAMSRERNRASTAENRDLDRLIRRYQRAKDEVLKAEASYKIDSAMTIVKGIELLVHHTPQTFNPLPDRDSFAFEGLQQAAENLKPELENYIDEFASETELMDLQPLLDDVNYVVNMPAPGTGNRLLDFMEGLSGPQEK